MSNGTHNITVYAMDEAGNVGVSETITFSVAKESETFPITLVASASIASGAVAGIVLFYYFRKRNR